MSENKLGRYNALGRMDKDIKDQWLRDLRSGEYIQGWGWLVRSAPDGTMRYCCLGVLGDREWPDMSLDSEVAGVIPSRVARPLGLTKGTQYDLANMNDQGRTFNEIADWIEENIPV